MSLTTSTLPRPVRPWRRRLKSLAVLVVACYLGVFVLLLALESRFIFHPTPAAVDWTPPPDDRFQDVTLTSAAGDRIHGWWLPREGATANVFYCHGNAGNLSHRGRGLLRWSQELNASVLIFDYPGYGKSTGVPTEAGCYAAADVMWDHHTGERHADPRRMILVGVSLGGAMATDLAARQPHRALVLLKAFASVPDMAQSMYPWLPARYFVRSRFDNLSNIARCPGPTFILHNRHDTLVPFRHGELLFAAAREPKRLYIQDEGDHEAGLPDDFFAQLRDFLASHPAAD
jgi:fermentation-respiration switch protein FrsA (DUF1100 family)